MDARRLRSRREDDRKSHGMASRGERVGLRLNEPGRAITDFPTVRLGRDRTDDAAQRAGSMSMRAAISSITALSCARWSGDGSNFGCVEMTIVR